MASSWKRRRATLIGSEGWTFPQHFANMDEYIRLYSSEEALIGTFKRLGIEASLSDPGLIAKQVLENLGNMWGVGLIADREIITLLNKMAGSRRTKGNETEIVEEHFGRKSAPLQDWVKVLKDRKSGFRSIELKDYTERNIIRLGLETRCPNCQGYNWHGMDTVNYEVNCERCLKTYPFPQSSASERQWKYRVIGPFSVPDFADGSYCSLLALRALTSNMLTDGATTFCTSLNLKFDKMEREVDFAALQVKGLSINPIKEPKLIIGECKSLGKGELLKAKDFSKLKDIVKKLSGCVIVISVMRDHFTPKELVLLKKFVTWVDRQSRLTESPNDVILFTGNELFVEYHISEAWKALGKPYSDFADYNNTRDLSALAQSTQAIYLGEKKITTPT